MRPRTVKRILGQRICSGTVILATSGMADGNRGNPQMHVRTILQTENVLPHGACITNQPVRPYQHALALRRKALKPRSSLYKRCVEHLLEALNAERQCWLGNATTFRGTAKMLFTRQRDHEFQFLKHCNYSCCDCRSSTGAILGSRNCERKGARIWPICRMFSGKWRHGDLEKQFFDLEKLLQCETRRKWH